MTQISNKAGYDKYNQAYNTFIGGQNSAAAPDNLHDNELKIAENFDVISRGSLRVRNGTVNVNWSFLSESAPANKGVTRLVEFSKPDGTLVRLGLINGKLFKEGNSLALLGDIGEHLDAAIYNNKAYILMKNSYYIYDGDKLSEVTNTQADSQLAEVKKCKFIEVRADRIYMAGNPDKPNALYFSQVGDPSYFKGGAHTLNVPSSEGDMITGIKEFSDVMLVFKANGIWAWSGYSLTEDVQFNKLNSHTGTRHYRTIQLVNSYLYFLGEDGIYMLKAVYQGSLVTEKISMAVDDVFSDIYFKQKPYENTAAAIYSRGKYYLSFPSRKQPLAEFGNNQCVVGFIDAGQGSNLAPFTTYTNVNFDEAMKSGDGEVYFAASCKKAIFKFSETAYSDAGTPIKFRLESKDYDMGSAIHVKKFKKVYLWVNQDKLEESVVNVNLKVDYSDTDFTNIDMAESMLWDVDTWNFHKWGWINTVTRAFKLSGKGIRICLSADGETNDTNKNRVFIYGIGITYKIKRLYKD